MKYIVYLTTNIKTHSIYVGVHKTENPEIFDGYIGDSIWKQYPSTMYADSTHLHHAVQKYGFDAFKRSIIKVFNTEQEALDLEAEIVNEEFIKRKDTYNMVLGGGLPPILNKVIYQYDLKGNFLKKWDSIIDAARFYNVATTSISRAVSFKRTASNSLWSDLKLDKLDIKEYVVYSPKIPVYIYLSSGEFYKAFDSMRDCCRELQITLSKVQRGISTGNLVAGYYLSTTISDMFVAPKLPTLKGKIHQYDLEGNYIQSFNTLKEAELKLGYKLSELNRSILKHGQCQGFQWTRGDEHPSKLDPCKTKATKARKIGQYTMEGELVKVFNTLRECRKEFPNVSKVLNGTANHCHNFKFKYIEES